MTKAFNEILKTKNIPDCWKEAKIIILFKKGDSKDIKNYRPISLLAHTYKLFTRLLQSRMERQLDENQPREQAGFRKHYSTTDHLQALGQTIDKCQEYNLPLCIGFIDYEKAFDSIEHFAIIEALRNININDIYVELLQNIYKEATARIHIDNHVSEKFEIERGVRQGDPISPKLFTAAIEDIFKLSDLQKGINIDGEQLKDLRFADDVALCTEDTKQMERNLNILNANSKKVGLKIHKEKTKYMTNYETTQQLEVENKVIERVTQYKYLGQTIQTENRMPNEIDQRIRAGWSSFGKNKEILQDRDIPMCLKRKVFNQCIIPTITYGCQTWTLTEKIMRKIRTTQRAMERKMLGIKLQDKVPNNKIRQQTGTMDIAENILRLKWKWAGHLARTQDNRWTKRCTEWQPREGKRSRGRPQTRWRDDIRKAGGPTWSRTAKDRQRWRALSEGYIQQWMDNA